MTYKEKAGQRTDNHIKYATKRKPGKTPGKRCKAWEECKMLEKMK